jgi:hypothetical protein
MTREDVAVALVKLKGYDKSRLADLSIIKAMFKDYELSLTRAQASAMLYRAYQYGNDNKNEQKIKGDVPNTTPIPTPLPPPTPMPTTVTEATY